jgi:cytochrome c biogenesis factor
MKRIHYNLAGARRIDARAFTLVLAGIGLAVLLLNAVTVFNLARQQKQSRDENSEIRSASLRLERLQHETQRQREEIVALKKSWERKLALANLLIGRKSFSFISRLNFLEKACSAGMRIHQLSLANEAAGRVQMTVSALAQNELLGFYKKLLPYALAIASENQMTEYYQATLSIRFQDEKK